MTLADIIHHSVIRALKEEKPKQIKDYFEPYKKAMSPEEIRKRKKQDSGSPLKIAHLDYSPKHPVEVAGKGRVKIGSEEFGSLVQLHVNKLLTDKKLYSTGDKENKVVTDDELADIIEHILLPALEGVAGGEAVVAQYKARKEAGHYEHGPARIAALERFATEHLGFGENTEQLEMYQSIKKAFKQGNLQGQDESIKKFGEAISKGLEDKTKLYHIRRVANEFTHEEQQALGYEAVHEAAEEQGVHIKTYDQLLKAEFPDMMGIHHAIKKGKFSDEALKQYGLERKKAHYKHAA